MDHNLWRQQKNSELLNSLVDEIGEEKGIQIITSNRGNYVLANKVLKEREREREKKHFF